MAARINAEINQKHREAIQTTQLVKRLQMYALGEPDPQSGKPVELKGTQVKAIEVLLDRVMPKLQSVEGAMDLSIVKHEQALDDLDDKPEKPPTE